MPRQALRHLAEERAGTRGDWVFVGVLLVAIVGMALAPLIVLYWLVHAIAVWIS